MQLVSVLNLCRKQQENVSIILINYATTSFLQEKEDIPSDLIIQEYGMVQEIFYSILEERVVQTMLKIIVGEVLMRDVPD
jgi:hypothetical protein